MLRVPGKMILIGLDKLSLEQACQQETESFPFKKVRCHQCFQRIISCRKLCVGLMVGASFAACQEMVRKKVL